MSELKETPLGMVSADALNGWNLVIHYMKPIMPFYTDPLISEIMINKYDTIFVEGRHGKVKTDARFESEADLQRLIRQMAIVLNQDNEKLDILDARFPDQSRACCTLPIVTPTGATLTIRCAPKIKLKFKDLIEFGALTEEMCAFLRNRVEKEDNMIVSGSTNSGKTTILRATSEFIPLTDRVLCCEDTQELHLDLPNQIPMEAPKRAGTRLNLSDLVMTTLRMSPDRVFVGEIRNAGACDAFLQVINTGHSGCATSLHANSPSDAIRRIQYMLAKEGLISYELAAHEIKHSVSLFVHCSKTKHGKRITDISVLDEHKNVLQIFGYDEETDTHFKAA